MSRVASETSVGFDPIAAKDARVLVLGSLPSKLSLEKRQYYGNPQNAFWRIMGELVGAGPDIAYELRAERLRQRGIAVWDVLRSAARPGSMDASIDLASATANDFATFYRRHPGLVLVCFNGKKAAHLYERLVAVPGTGTIAATGNFEMKTLPSTSPAYAAMSYAEKLGHWSVVRQATEKPGKT